MQLRHALLGLALLAAAGACSAIGRRVASGGAGGSQGISLASGGGSAACTLRCSADLHSVVDCDGNVISTCPPDKGCAAEGCVSPCESAQQNQGSLGCDYYLVAPDSISDAWGGCFAAFVANTWDAPVTLQVSRAGQMLDAASFSYLPSGSGQGITYAPLPDGGLPAGQVAIVFLGGDPSATVGACPPDVTVGYAGDAATHGTGIGDAFHITTSAPVVAYDIFPYGGGQSAMTSATLLLPTTAWDTNYIAVDAYQESQLTPGAQPFSEIVAMEAGTAVTIRPTAAIVAGPGVAGTRAGAPVTYTLDQGQVLQLTQDTELTGSVVQANHPIGFWGGASCLNIPVDVDACDSAHQQIPPVKALGHEYVAVRYRNRFEGMPDETPPWRLVGAVDGTVLTWDPPAAPAGAPLTLDSGELRQFDAAGPFTVRSQDENHPFYMSAHMTGWNEVTSGNAEDWRGDPEFVNVVPPQQYLASYTFFTDPTYPETDLVLVRRKGPKGFQDVTLDCAGTLTGWMPVGTAGEYQYTRMDLVTGDFVGQNGCDNGLHQIRSSTPFGVTVWGWGSAATGGQFEAVNVRGFYSQAVSYAYPAGASVQRINTVVVRPTVN